MSYLTRVLGSVGISAALVLSAASSAAPAYAGDRKGEACGAQDCKRGGKGCEAPAPAEATGAKVRARGWNPEKKEAVTGHGEPTCMAINTKGGAAGPGPTPPKKKD